MMNQSAGRILFGPRLRGEPRAFTQLLRLPEERLLR